MNPGNWKSCIVVFIYLLLSVVLHKGVDTVAAETTAPAEPQDSMGSSQGTELQIMPNRGKLLDDPALFVGEKVQSVTINEQAVTLETTARFYHIPGSVLTPVDSSTSLVYDYMGCVHASAGATSLLNAPLEIPDGSKIVLLRLYYDDTSADSISSWITRYNEAGTGFEDLVFAGSLGDGGHASSYGNLDHIVDTYNWRYVLNVRLNSASSTLQVCGLRVMYYAPAVESRAVFFPIVGGGAQQ
jgi:hypothetical protein